jgi:hypothetical protein
MCYVQEMISPQLQVRCALVRCLVAVCVLGMGVLSARGYAQVAPKVTRWPYYPYWRVEGGVGSGFYSDRAKDDPIGRTAQVDRQSIVVSEQRAAVAFRGFETEFGYGVASSESEASWQKKSDYGVRESFYWQAFPWVQPGIGYWEIRQVKRNFDDGYEPVAFVSRNNGLTVGLNTRFSPSLWKSHGPVFSGRLDYRASFEPTRNFGNQQMAGIGYHVAWGPMRLTVEWRYMRDFYSATQVTRSDETREISLRHVSFTRQMWLGLSFWPYAKRR